MDTHGGCPGDQGGVVGLDWGGRGRIGSLFSSAGVTETGIGKSLRFLSATLVAKSIWSSIPSGARIPISLGLSIHAAGLGELCQRNGFGAILNKSHLVGVY